METDATEQPPGSVAQVLESGYMLHDRLLRPARVVVAKAGQQSSQAAER
jgi:molecular chaperone GrpE